MKHNKLTLDVLTFYGLDETHDELRSGMERGFLEQEMEFSSVSYYDQALRRPNTMPWSKGYWCVRLLRLLGYVKVDQPPTDT